MSDLVRKLLPQFIQNMDVCKVTGSDSVQMGCVRLKSVFK